MKQYKIFQVDAFTKEKFKGNPAGVVINADGLSDEQMQSIARELNNSETAFLFAPEENSADGRIRYFSPTMEVPICGHATIAAMYVKAIEERLDSCILNIKTNIGILPFEIIKEENDYKIIMTQGPIKIDPPLKEEYKKRIIQALKLSNEDLELNCPIQIASTGHSKVMIGIKSRNTLNNLSPNFNELIEISRQIKCNGYFVFTFDSEDHSILTHGRMFAPAIGINEDPVTGNANGPLGAYLINNNLVDYSNDIFTFTGAQGEKIGRNGTMEIRVKIKDHKPELIQIVGDAVIIFKTELYF